MRISDWSSDVCSSDLDSRRATLEQGRDMAAQSMQRALKADLDKLTERLASDRVQAALAAGDLAAAGTALGDGWKGVEEAAVLPPGLEQAYEGLPKTGFGRIAVLEAAMTEDKPGLWAIRADGTPGNECGR